LEHPRHGAGGWHQRRVGGSAAGGDGGLISRARLAAGEGVKKVAKAVGVGNGTVARIKTAMAA
jgi:hypothetical protein